MDIFIYKIALLLLKISAENALFNVKFVIIKKGIFK